MSELPKNESFEVGRTIRNMAFLFAGAANFGIYFHILLNIRTRAPLGIIVVCVLFAASIIFTGWSATNLYKYISGVAGFSNTKAVADPGESEII